MDSIIFAFRFVTLCVISISIYDLLDKDIRIVYWGICIKKCVYWGIHDVEIFIILCGVTYAYFLISFIHLFCLPITHQSTSDSFFRAIIALHLIH